jgi:choline dehydrogenase-like flavoprotein
MIIDLAREALPADFSPDVCVVGAGAAGITLAAELLHQRRRVLLLESGGRELESAAQTLNAYALTGQPQQASSIGHFRVLGGTTTKWGGQILPFTREDFERRPWISGSGWPFTYTQLEPYYARAIRAEGLAPALQQDDAVWQTLGMPVPALGEGLVPYFTRWCPEPDFARLHGPTLTSPNVCVALHATVIGIQMNANGDGVTGLQCRTPEGKVHTFTAAHYVFSLGTIETVRLLLQPMPSQGLAPWQRNGILGQHFQSHIDFDAATISSPNLARLRGVFANVYTSGFKYHPKMRLARNAQQADQVLNIAGAITATHPAERALTDTKAFARRMLRGRFDGISMNDVSRAVGQIPLLLKLTQAYLGEHRAYWAPDSELRLRVHCEQEPLSKSTIALTEDRDASGMFRARLDWRISPFEWASIRRFAERVQQALHQLGLGHCDLAPALTDPEGFRNVVFDNSHHDMGGSRMAEDPANGVVTPELRLHGVRNAFVCSASVFPTSGFSNPTHTLIALAIRLADHLAAQLGGPHA